MSSAGRIFIVGICSVILMSGLAWGQVSGGDALEFSVFLRGDYTDNRDSSEFNKEDNFDFYVRPRADAFLNWDNGSLDAFYAPAFRVRSDASPIQNDNEWYHSLGVMLSHQPSPRLRITANEKFDYTDDSSIDEGGTTVREDRSYWLNRADGSAAFAVTRQTTLEAYVGSKVKRYDESVVADTSDEDRTDFGLIAWQQMDRTLVAFGEVRTSDFGYDSPGGIDRDFDMLFAAAGLEKDFSKNLRGRASFGWQFQEFNDPGLDKQDEPFAQVRIEGSTTPDLKLTAEATYAIRDSDAFPFASQTYSEIHGRGAWDVDSKVTLIAWSKYRVGNYDDSAPTTAGMDAFPTGQTGGDEKTLELAGEVGYKVSDDSSIKLVQHFEDVDSDVSKSFTKNTTSLVFSRHF